MNKTKRVEYVNENISEIFPGKNPRVITQNNIDIQAQWLLMLQVGKRLMGKKLDLIQPLKAMQHLVSFQIHKPPGYNK